MLWERFHHGLHRLNPLVSVLSFFIFYSGGIHGMQVFPSFAEEEPPQTPPEGGALYRRLF